MSRPRQRRAPGARLPVDSPAREIVCAVRPALVLVSVLNARPGGRVVEIWRCDDINPVGAFHGLRSTDHLGRKIGVWAPELAARISHKT